MEKIILVIFGIIFFLITSIVSAEILNHFGKITLITSVSTNPNIILWLPLDEDSGCVADDLSQYNNDGTLKPDCPANGPTWGSLNFDGVDDYVEIPSSTSLDIINTITIEAWINPISYTFYPQIIGKGNVGNYTESYAIFLEDGIGRVGFLLNKDGTTSGRSVLYGTVIPLNSFTHVLGTYDGTIMKLYINGTEVASGSHSGGIFITTYPVTIAKSERENSPYPISFFNGIISNPRIWNITLTQEQIQSIYQEGVDG